MMQSGQPLDFKLATAGANSVELSLSAGPSVAEIMDVPAGSFLRGSAAFWAAHLGPRGELLANRWVQVPPTTAQTFNSQLGRFAPATLARCLVEDHGTLSVAGRTTVDGRDAVVVRDAGNVPGDGPGTLAVAASGPPYPLQVTSTGPQHPGGVVDVCNDGKGGTLQGTLTFSDFGHVPPISPPPHPISFGQTPAT